MKARLPVLFVLLLCGCAARGPARARAPVPSPLARAEALVRAGCYRCLEEAHDIYSHAATIAASRLPALHGDLVVQVLLAARTRELGLHDTPDWEQQATTLAAALPATDLQRLYLELVGHIPRPAGSGNREGVDRPRDIEGAIQGLLARAAALLPARLRHDPAAAYFAASLTCTFGTQAPVPPDAIPLSPLVAYKLGSCDRNLSPHLEEVLTTEPRFVEAHFFRARHAFGGGLLVAADNALALALAGFPTAPSMRLMAGQIALQLEEPDRARDHFEAVVQAVPEQPEALLGLARSFSYLDQPEQARSACNRLLEGRTWYQGEAYYWRAWSWRRLKQLDRAFEDIEAAKRTLYNAAVPKLAGFIAIDRQQDDRALAELLTARERNQSDCDVHTALGHVHARRGRWPDAALSYSEASACAQAAQQAADARLREIESAPLDAARRERFRARAERDRAEARTREGLTAFYAANAFVLANYQSGARKWAERALLWPEWQARARDLLDKLPR